MYGIFEFDICQQLNSTFVDPWTLLKCSPKEIKLLDRWADIRSSARNNYIRKIIITWLLLFAAMMWCWAVGTKHWVQDPVSQTFVVHSQACWKSPRKQSTLRLGWVLTHICNIIGIQAIMKVSSFADFWEKKVFGGIKGHSHFHKVCLIYN